MKETPVHREVAVLRLEGDIGAGVAPSLEWVINEARSRPLDVLVDLTAARFIDSSALGVFLSALRRLRRSGSRFGLICPQPANRRLIELVGLDRVLLVETTLAGALEKLGREGPERDGSAAS